MRPSSPWSPVVAFIDGPVCRTASSRAYVFLIYRPQNCRICSAPSGTMRPASRYCPTCNGASGAQDARITFPACNQSDTHRGLIRVE